ncbi:MAG: sugar ABC transporter substrate-binding protein [bacterium]|nr:sugar ABC transporter substrate-binding protein [bacterium]
MRSVRSDMELRAPRPHVPRLSALRVPACFALFVLCIALPAVAMGCDPSDETPLGSGDGIGQVTVWSWNIAAASLEGLIPAFSKRHPYIDVKIDMNGTNMQSRFLLSLVAGVGAPDISQLQLVDAPRFGPSGRMTDLTEFAAKYEKDFSPAFWANCTHEDRVYAIPWDMGPCAVFYKRDLFEKYHVDPDAIETWADYIEVGKRVVAESNGETRMLALSVTGLVDFFEILMQQGRGGVFDEQGRVNINSPENIEVLKVFRAILDADIASPVTMFSHEYFASFNNNRIATYPLAVWLGGSIKDYAPETEGNWGVFRLPALCPGGLRVSNLGGSVLVLPDQGNNKEAAWSFVEYALCTKEGQIAQYRDFDLFPCLMTTFDDPFFDEPDPFYGGQKVRRLFATEIEKIPVLTRTKDWNQAKRYIGETLSVWASEHLDHGEYLASLEERLCRKLHREPAPRSGEGR